MKTDDRDLLDLLKMELDFVEKGGYGRSVQTPWQATSIFQDSPACVGFPAHTHEDGCVLMAFVPAEQRCQGVPCHHIPLNEAGETIAALDQRGDQQQMEEAVKHWLRERIAQLEKG